VSQARTAIVIAGGSPLLGASLADLTPEAYIIAADSGLDHALAAELRPSHLVGDLDSVSEAGLRWARDTGVRIDEHSPDKDATDTELALAAAVATGAEHIVLLGGGGDRLDHTIGAIAALGHVSLAGCVSVTARWGRSHVHILHAPRDMSLMCDLGTTFSVLALHGDCHGVDLAGARWPLSGASIHPASSLGLSNETAAAELSVRIRTGVLTVIFPDRFRDST
jgi:thiamine pyrophosphokinase